MAEAVWKALLRAHIPAARSDSRAATDHLHHAMRFLRSPTLLHSRDAAGNYIQLDSAATNVGRAWMLLASSIAGMRAAELVSLRGCGRAPAQPVASIGNLRDGADDHHDVWLALARLESAREHGEEALPRIQAAFLQLNAARVIIRHLPPAAGRVAAMDQVRASADDINALEGSLGNMRALAALAAEPAICIQG